MKLRANLLTLLALSSSSYATDSNINATTPIAKPPSIAITNPHSSNSTTNTDDSVVEQQIKEIHNTEKNTLLIALYRPTYILPYYYTASPDYAVYQNSTPNNQKIMRSEFKAQLSFLVPIWSNMFNNPDRSLNIAYTQLNYWQVYASSQYFREVNYEPEIFFEDHYKQNYLLRAGLDHQSNGRGGDLERSWNRAIASAQYSGGENWLVSLKVWALIFQTQSSDLHNPDIATYLGYDNLRFSYRYHKATFSIEAQNLESGLRRGYVQITASYPMFQHISIFGQFFSGYGQSLIEYNHRTNAAGIGITFNDWI